MQLPQGKHFGAAVISLCSGSHALLDPPGCTHRSLSAERPGRLHHAPLGWLPAPSCGIATYPNRATDTAGLSPAGLQPCRLLRRPCFHVLQTKQIVLSINYASQSPHRCPGCLAPCHLPWYRAPHDLSGGLRPRRLSQAAGDDPGCNPNPLLRMGSDAQPLPSIALNCLGDKTLKNIGVPTIHAAKPPVPPGRGDIATPEPP